MIKAIIFDCFGVLLGKGFEHTYHLAGGDSLKDKYFIEKMLNKTNLGKISENEFNLAIADKLNISLTQWMRAMAEAELPDKELLNYIKSLRKNYKTAILSNANRGVLTLKLGDDWLRECFDEIIVSADYGVLKPDPRIYQIAIDKLGVDYQESVFIDDREMFLDVASRLGMKTIIYRDYQTFKNKLEKLLLNLDHPKS